MPIISRIKVIANEHLRKPPAADGRIKLTFENREVDLRVSTVPTVHGESVVMRVLDRSLMMMGIRNIGMMDEVLNPSSKWPTAPMA